MVRAGAAATTKSTAKSLIERASRVVTGHGGSNYDEDDLDVPAFIRRKNSK
jgi:hypothetical protein